MIEVKGMKRTNADVIRSMTDEQLCDFFISVKNGGDIDYSITFCDLCEKDGNAIGYDCEDCFRHWILASAYEYNGLLTDGINSGFVEVEK